MTGAASAAKGLTVWQPRLYAGFGACDMNFRVSRETDDFLESFARGNDISKAEALSRAIALLALAKEQQEKGRLLGIVEEDDKRELHAVGRVSGVFRGQ